MRYSLGHDLVFTILTLIASLFLISRLGLLSALFAILAIVYVCMEHKITYYLKTI
jgi:hypothetical protein